MCDFDATIAVAIAFATENKTERTHSKWSKERFFIAFKVWTNKIVT